MLEFGMYNANPKNKKTGDCVIRAISVATNQDYAVVMEDLFRLGMEKGFMINDQRTYEAYLTSRGWMKHPQPRHANNSWYKVRELDTLLPKHTTAIISTHGHVTVKVGNTLVDSFDCRGSAVGSYWTYVNETVDKPVAKTDIEFTTPKPRKRRIG